MLFTVTVLTVFAGILSLHFASLQKLTPLLSTAEGGARRRVSRRRRLRRRMERF